MDTAGLVGSGAAGRPDNVSGSMQARPRGSHLITFFKFAPSRWRLVQRQQQQQQALAGPT
jgi:hypothetical protein